MKTFPLKLLVILTIFAIICTIFTASISFADGQGSINKTTSGDQSVVQQDTQLYLREPLPGQGDSIDVSAETGSIGILAKWVGNIFQFIAALSVIIAVLVFMAAGYMMMFSGGDSGAKENAKTMIQQVLMGIALLFLSGLILNFVNPKFYIFGGGNNSTDDVRGAIEQSKDGSSTQKDTGGNTRQDYVNREKNQRINNGGTWTKNDTTAAQNRYDVKHK